MNNQPEDCIFCKIINGEVPSHKVYEDEHFVGILDINPQTPGHTQIIPKEHHRWVWDVPNAGEYFEAARKVAQAQRKAFDTDFIISRIVGDEVPHAHIWVFPNKGVAGDKKDFVGNAQRIRESIE